MLKFQENPSIIPPFVNTLSDLDGKWWVAYTKSRFEKVFAREMLIHEIGYFLPMLEKIIFSGGRKRRTMIPLFTSYVFFCGTQKDRDTALKTGRLCHVIEVAGQKVLKDELLNIEKAISNKAIIEKCSSFVAGNYCRVIAGPMAGIEGVVIENNVEKSRIVIEVTILGQGVVVEIDNDLLELLE